MFRRPLALLGAALVATFAASACSYTELSINGPCGGPAPLSERPSPDLTEYQAANAALLDAVPTPPGAQLIGIDQSPYHRCPEDAESDVIGVTSIGTFAIPEATAKCDVVNAIEEHLAADGWQFTVMQTSDPAGGTIRITDFRRGAKHIALSIGGVPQDYGLFVDHDSLQDASDPAAVPEQPCID